MEEEDVTPEEHAHATKEMEEIHTEILSLSSFIFINTQQRKKHTHHHYSTDTRG